jgi:anti-sigma factor ChrR (cupin superfamily)
VTPAAPDLADLVLSGPTRADPALCRDADAVVVGLAQFAGSAAPPPDARARLLTLITVEPRPFVQSQAEGQWEDWLFPGLSRRVLFVDEPGGRITMLLRLAAGARLPSHPHSEVEEVYMLEGDLHGDDGNVLWAGDYQRSEAGTVHVEQWSVNGCTALMIAPLFDEAA